MSLCWRYTYGYARLSVDTNPQTCISGEIIPVLTSPTSGCTTSKIDASWQTLSWEPTILSASDLLAGKIEDTKNY